MPLAEASGASCVQRFDGSRNSAIHTTYRISLRSSSIREPRYPLLRVVFGLEWTADELPTTRCFRISFSLGWVELEFPTSDPPKGSVPSKRRGPTCEGTPAGPEQQLGGATARGPTLAASHSPKRGRHRTRGTSGYQSGFDRFNDPSAGSPTETLLRLLLPLGGRV